MTFENDFVDYEYMHKADSQTTQLTPQWFSTVTRLLCNIAKLSCSTVTLVYIIHIHVVLYIVYIIHAAVQRISLLSEQRRCS